MVSGSKMHLKHFSSEHVCCFILSLGNCTDCWAEQNKCKTMLITLSHPNVARVIVSQFVLSAFNHPYSELLCLLLVKSTVKAWALFILSSNNSGRVKRVILVKCGLAGWARIKNSLLNNLSYFWNRSKVNICSEKQQACQSPCSADCFAFLFQLCIHTSLLGLHLYFQEKWEGCNNSWWGNIMATVNMLRTQTPQLQISHSWRKWNLSALCCCL